MCRKRQIEYKDRQRQILKNRNWRKKERENEDRLDWKINWEINAHSKRMSLKTKDDWTLNYNT
jgi:hypothetical protein